MKETKTFVQKKIRVLRCEIDTFCTNYTKTEYTDQIFGLGGVTCIALHDYEDDRSNPIIKPIVLLIHVITYYRGLFY